VNTSEESQPAFVESTRTSTVLGAVPSTIDEIHGIQEKPLDAESLKANVQVYLGHFGCASESGMFLRQRVRSEKGQNAAEEWHMVQTKIDLPYSYIYQDQAKVNSTILWGQKNLKKAERVPGKDGSLDGAD
jgi:hypothetical protein